MTQIYFSDFFGVEASALEDYGAFNVSLVSDLPLFVDPFLLFNSEEADYQQLHDDILRYMRFLKQVTLEGQLSKPLIDAWFAFPEVKQNWLGFSRAGNAGHGLGKDFAHALHRNFSSVFRNFGEETVTRSSHLEKLCLIRDGVGRDALGQVHFTATLTKATAVTTENYIASVAFQYVADKLGFQQRLRNPLGFVVTSYRVDQESLPKDGSP